MSILNPPSPSLLASSLSTGVGAGLLQPPSSTPSLRLSVHIANSNKTPSEAPEQPHQPSSSLHPSDGLRREVIPLKGCDDDSPPNDVGGNKQSVGGRGNHSPRNSVHGEASSPRSTRKRSQRDNRNSVRLSVTSPYGDQRDIQVGNEAATLSAQHLSEGGATSGREEKKRKPPPPGVVTQALPLTNGGISPKTPMTIRKTRLTLFTKQVQLPKWQQTLTEWRSLMRLLHFGLAIAAFTSLAAGTFSADFRSAVLSRSVYFFPSHLNITPHRHLRFSRVEVGIDILCGGLWIAACIALIAYGFCPAELFPDSTKCFQWNLTLSFGFASFFAYSG
ncbi:hypothetical protein BC829DRAFT_439120 [Chytridium lagenaria]|nr:hypothetical protein BC829DRAFT_439120 [Chytridium lagenaria]